MCARVSLSLAVFVFVCVWNVENDIIYYVREWKTERQPVLHLWCAVFPVPCFFLFISFWINFICAHRIEENSLDNSNLLYAYIISGRVVLLAINYFQSLLLYTKLTIISFTQILFSYVFLFFALPLLMWPFLGKWTFVDAALLFCSFSCPFDSHSWTYILCRFQGSETTTTAAAAVYDVN